MSDFIKKNMPLVAVLGITVVVAAVLIVLVVMQYDMINKKMTNIDKINREIDSITSQTNPRVVRENAKLINEDAVALQQKTKEQQRVFGCYLDPALQVFIDTLKKGAESEEFKEAVKGMTVETLHGILEKKVGEINTVNPQAQELKKIYQAVEAEILASANEADKAAYKKAFDAFIASASQQTLENLNDENSDFAVKEAVFLQALGLPRSFEKIKFAAYFAKYADDLVRNRKIPFANEKDNTSEQIKTYFFTTGELLTVDDDEEGGVQLDKINAFNIPHAMTRIQIYENLILNMKETGLRLISLRREHDFMPDELGDDLRPYDTYKTQIRVCGTMSQIREFANRLHQEYQNNRVYLVKSMSIDCDDSQKVAQTGRKQKNYSREISQTLGYVKIQETEKMQVAEDENTAKIREQNKAYLASIGAPLLGVNDKVYAVFCIDYIVFTGDQVMNAKK